MPQAKTDQMCPQCGCREFTATVTGNHFRCGERISCNSLETSYTCHTVAKRMPFMEDALEQAARCLLANYRVSATSLDVARALSRASDMNPYTPLPRQSSTLARFVRDEIAVRFGNMQYVPTRWGRIFMAQMLAQEDAHKA